MESANDLLTVKQAADIKRAHIKSVYRAIKEGRLPSQKAFGITVVRRGDLAAWPARGGRFNPKDA